jgi:hypothetical protein
MLVDAREITPGSAPPADAVPCPAAPGSFPTAYELTGSHERDAGAFVGRRVQVTGMQKHAKTEPVGTSGTLRPTGGFDPLGHELHLFELDVASVGEIPPARAAAPPAPTAPESVAARAPQPEAVPPAPPETPSEAAAAPEPPAAQAAAQPIERGAVEQPERVARAELPRTASPLPLVGLIGLVSFVGAAGLRALRRRW